MNNRCFAVLLLTCFMMLSCNHSVEKSKSGGSEDPKSIVPEVHIFDINQLDPASKSCCQDSSSICLQDFQMNNKGDIAGVVLSTVSGADKCKLYPYILTANNQFQKLNISKEKYMTDVYNINDDGYILGSFSNLSPNYVFRYNYLKGGDIQTPIVKSSAPNIFC